MLRLICESQHKLAARKACDVNCIESKKDDSQINIFQPYLRYSNTRLTLAMTSTQVIMTGT